ncbi:PSD1 and planctomycete cytochrome C domain-containing protein [Gemmata sp. JC717]|uniref:PSD1 and planctomycete cytochrome C domain-containing protein n=1 Tax=Gemmata algarum TaxID=2975278 RepID=UPI0021BA6089|nr:PSD1 and planctomycete cytochrome C domain-containing protein [Gemmata algarum]MDY3552586.1 PSD1 and planctomycete cytochrome C domain-containing protein [Gemmata algarum]
MRWFLALCAASCVVVSARAADPAKPTAAQLEYFEAKVRPVLADHCYSCHGPKKQSAGLRLDTSTGIKAGADDGPVVVPGDPVKSRLIKSVKRENELAMPPKSPLPAEAVAVLVEWVKSGAALPAETAQGPAVDPKKHWAFQPVRAPLVPAAPNPKGESRNEIDAFVGAKLAEKGLAIAPRADKRALVRRAYFDLTGLPPTAEEVEAFVKDAAPDAWARLVDKLLASPRYGERWGRYWLDVARYADSKGYDLTRERAFPFSYTYRDYVVRSFNEDKPYDRFVTEQLAADLLPLGADKRPLAALGFLTLGRRFLNNQQDIIDDRIDVVTRGFMGLTVTCARCHDHKYDPIPAKDYYSLYGVFASTNEPAELPLIGDMPRTPEVIAFEKEVETREAAIVAERDKRHAATVAKLREPAAVAEYLLAVLDTRDARGEEVQNLLRQRDLTRLVYDRWREFVAAEVKAKSAVFVPLQALAAVPEKDFEAKALAALPQGTNPLVAKALTDAKPKTLKAAVDVFAKALCAAPPAGTPSKEQAEVAKALAKGGPTDIALADAEKIQNRADRDAIAAIRKKVDTFKAASPHAPPRAHVLADNAQPTQPVVFLRGNPGNRGPQVPRQAPEIVTPNRKPFTQGSGRLELARAITSPENPLTARVMVNRVWLGHFGHGLLRTPSDFGVRSDPPSHPELLDYLASTFVREGWSVKRLHRAIMLSATYQQSSAVTPEMYKLDPENRLLAHQNRRRLDFEALRDSLLSASGRLDLTEGGKPVDLFKAPFSARRTVYGLIDRTSLPGTFKVFDVANPDTHSPQRFQTTVPQQALFLMNSPFVQEQAKSLAARKEVAAAKTAAAKVTTLYRLALSRNPTADELALATRFVAGDDPKSAFGAWPQLAQVLLLSNEFAFVD